MNPILSGICLKFYQKPFLYVFTYIDGIPVDEVTFLLTFIFPPIFIHTPSSEFYLCLNRNRTHA